MSESDWEARRNHECFRRREAFTVEPSVSPEMERVAYSYGFVEGADFARAETLKDIEPLVHEINSSMAALTYAYEDLGDDYYMNVKRKVAEALANYRKLTGAESE